MNTIYITTNYDCNLDCNYCYEKGKRNSNVFSIQQAQNLLSDILNKDIEDKFTVIDFHGGEPFLVFNEIKELCEWAWSQKFLHDFLFFATSNGTLIHGEIQDWLTLHKDKFGVSISIDGTKEMHDLNRSNSFDLIDLDFFINTWPDQGVKMTISPETLPNLAGGIVYLHERGIMKIHSNLAEFVNWNKEEYQEILKTQLELLSEYYLQHPNIKPCFLYAPYIATIFETTPKYKKWCGAGTEIKTYDLNGRGYPCHLFFETFCGKEKSEEALKIDFSNPKEFVDDECETCVILRFCPTCYGANYLMNGKIGKRNKMFCTLYKINAQVSCQFEYTKIQMQLEEKSIENFSDEEKFVITQKLKAINEISTKINS